jgi:hypothetical protein
LGAQISDYKDRVDMDTRLPLRQSRYLHEVEARDQEGFQDGLIWIGNCAAPGRIVRIRLKYANNTRKFYDELLKRYKKRFGEPSEWRGDPFQVVISWKWSFTDPAGNRISLILQHNTRDEEESFGNTVKMTLWNLIDAERLCWEKKSAANRKKTTRQKSPASPDWDKLLPH